MYGKLSLFIAASDKNYENYREFYRKTALKD